jgi:aminoglycoside phosphotransferase (APT) family kinase protein
MSTFPFDPSFDVAALEKWLCDKIEDFDGPLTATRFTNGQSNPTFLLSSPKGKYVLRKKPDGALLPSAHAVEREYRVIRALENANVPVPRGLGLCEDVSVIGAPFYVMTYIAGRIFWDPTLRDLEREQRQALYDDMNRVIAELHRIDPLAIGLGDYGRPGHYLERQVRRWTKQYLASQTGPIEAMDRLIGWLPKHLPSPGATSIVHGDLRLDNIIFHPLEPRVIALLDWELSTLGDPLADFAYHMLTWVLRSDEFRGMADANLPSLGIPAANDYLRLYVKRRGLTSIGPDLWEFHLVYNLFRLAAILQGIAKRAKDGTASSSQAQETGAKAQRIAELAWKRASQCLGAV